MNALNQELLDIFLEEATDLLNQISITIENWSTDLNNKALFADLKRDLHTLKGSARMVNQSDLSALAHELESFCEFLLSGFVETNKNAYDLICKGQDRMHIIVENLRKKEKLPDTKDILNLLLAARSVTGTDTDTAVTPNSNTRLLTHPSALPTQPLSSDAQDETHHSPKVKIEDSNQNMIRVKANLLEKLNNLSIEINITRVNIGHFIENFNTQLAEAIRTLKMLQEKMRGIPKEYNFQGASEIQGLTIIFKMLSQTYANIDALISEQARISLELQERLVDTRMIPFDSVIPRLSRITRQISDELKKQVDFSVLQTEGEIDRNLLEHLIPSLEHLLRNSLDHGIELPSIRIKAKKPEIGKITLRFFRAGNDACIEISDDGAGIDAAAVRKKAVSLGFLSESTILPETELIRYILEPGFSTREAISEISGRGIGMDVVNTVVKGLGGNLSIGSILGQGAKFTIRLPFTTSINRALLVMAQGQTFGILLSNIEAIILLEAGTIKTNLHSNDPIIYHNDIEYQLKYLGSVLDIEDWPIFNNLKSNLPVLLLKFSNYNTALVVDGLAGSQEAVVQTLGPQFKLMDTFSGATLLADGRAIVILDTYAIVSKANKKMNEISEITLPSNTKPNVLVVDDSLTIRTVTKNFLERHKYSVQTAKDGLDALEKMERQKPDIILLDVEMPRMNGFQLVENIRQNVKYSNTPIIMITFCAGEEQRLHAKKLGVEKFLSKPYREQELLEIMTHLLETR